MTAIPNFLVSQLSQCPARKPVGCLGTRSLAVNHTGHVGDMVAWRRGPPKFETSRVVGSNTVSEHRRNRLIARLLDCQTSFLEL